MVPCSFDDKLLTPRFRFRWCPVPLTIKVQHGVGLAGSISHSPRWCRTERVARELSTRKGGYVIIVESATHQTLMWAGNRMSDAPGEGDFTLDVDRVGIGRMVTQMIWSKLFHYLEHREFHNYRFLLNSQAALYFRALDAEPIDGLVPGFRTQTDPSVDPKGFMLDRFLHQNGFRSAEAQNPLHPNLREFRLHAYLLLCLFECTSRHNHCDFPHRAE